MKDEASKEKRRPDKPLLLGLDVVDDASSNPCVGVVVLVKVSDGASRGESRDGGKGTAQLELI
jgi:hypothetical protein